MTKTLAAALLVAGLALAGCGVPSGASGTPGPAGGDSPAPDGSHTSSPDPGPSTLLGASGALPERLLGRSFETRGPGDVTGFDLVPDSTLTLTFDADPDGAPTLGAGAGCNHMGGPVAWDAGTARPIDGFARTEMACDGLMEQEDWFFALLNAGLTFSLDGDYLTARSADGATEILLEDSAVLNPDAPLAGMIWRLDGLIQGTGDSASISSAPPGLTASLQITRDPKDGHLRLDAFDGLTWMSAPGGFDAATGEYSGSVTIEPSQPDALDEFADGTPDPLSAKSGTVRVSGELGGDAIGCASDKPDCRVAEMALLGGDFTFETHQDRLTVTGTGKYAGHGLTFVVDPTAPAPDLDVYLAETDNPLLGKTFELTRTFTDAGGVDHKHADATLRLTFTADHVTADGSCGAFGYDGVRYIADPTNPTTLANVDLGTPGVASCVIGEDPPGPPADRLMYGVDGDEMWLSTGFVMWYFRAVN